MSVESHHRNGRPVDTLVGIEVPLSMSTLTSCTIVRPTDMEADIGEHVGISV